eukprot:gene18392-24864_t
MTTGEDIATGIFERGGTSEVDVCSDADTIGLAQEGGCLACRLRIDMHDRRAYVRKVAAWHAD